MDGLVPGDWTARNERASVKEEQYAGFGAFDFAFVCTKRRYFKRTTTPLKAIAESQVVALFAANALLLLTCHRVPSFLPRRYIVVVSSATAAMQFVWRGEDKGRELYSASHTPRWWWPSWFRKDTVKQLFSSSIVLSRPTIPIHYTTHPPDSRFYLLTIE